MSMSDTEYTAQDYRQMVCDLENNLKHGMERVVIASPKLIDMVLQAAETRERAEERLSEHKDIMSDKDYMSEYIEQTRFNHEQSMIEDINYILRGDAGKGGEMICAECGK